MAYRYLPADLPARLRAAGLEVVVLPGWEDRGRPASTGSFDPVGVLWHHTGGASDTRAYAEWMTYEGRPDLPAPLCQLSISRKGTVYVCAAGRSNHAGRAKASGSVAAGDGNALYVGVECMNTGSEGWPPEQYGAMVATGAVLADLLGTSVDAQRAHRETSVTGKWDPGRLDMDRFRADIAARINQEDDMPFTEKQLRQIIREEARAAVDDVLEVDMNINEPKGSPEFRGKSLRGVIKDIYRAVVKAADAPRD